MFMFCLLAAGALMGAVLYRIKGSAEFKVQFAPLGGTAARLFWVSGMALIAGAAYYALPGGAWWFLPLLLLGLFLSTLAPQWRSLSMGRNAADGPMWQQWARHTARGLLSGFCIFVPLWLAGLGGWGMLVAGLMHGLCYEAGYRINEDLGTVYGERWFGALIGYSLVAEVFW